MGCRGPEVFFITTFPEPASRALLLLVSLPSKKPLFGFPNHRFTLTWKWMVSHSPPPLNMSVAWNTATTYSVYNLCLPQSQLFCRNDTAVVECWVLKAQYAVKLLITHAGFFFRPSIPEIHIKIEKTNAFELPPHSLCPLSFILKVTWMFLF